MRVRGIDGDLKFKLLGVNAIPTERWNNVSRIIMVFRFAQRIFIRVSCLLSKFPTKWLLKTMPFRRAFICCDLKLENVKRSSTFLFTGSNNIYLCL